MRTSFEFFFHDHHNIIININQQQRCQKLWVNKNTIKLHLFPKSCCCDCVLWWIYMWQLRHILQQHNTEGRGIRGNRSLQHFRPDSPSHPGDTTRQVSPASYSMFMVLCDPKSWAELQFVWNWKKHRGCLSRFTGMLFCTKPSALPRKHTPCSCTICTPKLTLVH